jgi:hypothetical protein
MSRQGYLVFYTESSKLDVVHILKHLPELVGFERADFVWRSRGTPTCPEDLKYDDIGDDILATELWRLYVPGTCLYVSAERASLGKRIEKAVQEHIPKEIQGKARLHRPFFRAGKHFLYDAVRGDDGEIFAYPTLTVGCWGYETPADHPEYCRRVLKLEAVEVERQRLEHLVGNLKVDICYYV